MKRWYGSFFVNIIVFWFLNYISHGELFDNNWSILWASILLLLLNLCIRPLLSLLSLPLTLITFGLFSFIVSAVVIAIMDALMPSVHFHSFAQYIMAAILISVGGSVLNTK